MSSTVITPGYTGYAMIENPVGSAGGSRTDKLRFNTCSLNATQEVEAPDMVTGDYTHNSWAYGKIEVAGRLSGPVTESTMIFINDVWNAAQQIDVKYYSGQTRSFRGMRANSLTLNVTAGEVVQFDLDLIGTGYQTGPVMTGYTDVNKLVTWDKAAFYIGPRAGYGNACSTDTTSWYNLAAFPDLGTPTIPPAASSASSFEQLAGLQAFSITLSNNITRQFIIKASDLFGDLVAGMSAITGQVTSYIATGGTNMSTSKSFTGSGAYYWNAYTGGDYYPFQFYVGASTVRGTVAFHRATTELGVGPVMSTVAMTGIGHFSSNQNFSMITAPTDPCST
jgi:hypothetical protein